jgi:hypothetical protein
MTTSLLLIGLLVAAPGTDSLPALKKCGPARTPVGIARLTGTVAFGVSARGDALLDSLTILQVSGSSGPGLRSVLERYLPACKFKAAKHDRQTVTVRVRATVTLEDGAMRWSPLTSALAADSIDAADLPLPASLGPADTLAFTDPRLEERPAVISCSQRLVARDAVVPKSELPPAPALPTPGAEVLLRYTVMPDGTVPPRSVQVVQAPSRADAERAQAMVTDCTWVPGRVGGVPVPVRIASRERF